MSVVVPVYRNAATLEELHERLARTLRAAGRSYELLFVDDACPAGSWEVLRRLAPRDPCVAALALSRNVGQNRAVLAGLAHARGRVAVILDGDLQDPPEAIPRLLAALDGGAAVAFAGRRGRYESRLRLATSRGLKWLLHVASRRRLPPDAGLFVALRREAVERLLSVASPDPYVVGLIARTRLPMVSLPVERSPHGAGPSAYSQGMRFRLAWRALRSVAGPLPRRREPAPAVPVREYLGALGARVAAKQPAGHETQEHDQ